MKTVRVYALVGESGSGKSHRAVEIAVENEIDYIIDDGLFINDTKKIAGSSAKREKTKIMAVKRAIFFKEDHRQEVKEAILKENPDKILVIGTSLKMIMKIVTALEVPDPEKVIYIRDISSEEDIVAAKKMRNDFGHHIIPLPEIEVQKDFPFYWLNPFHSIAKRKDKKVEKTIVRPHFSNIGKLVISENVIHQIVKNEKLKYSALSKTLRDIVLISDEGVDIHIELRVKVKNDLPQQLYDFKGNLEKIIGDTTGLQVRSLKIDIKGIDFTNEQK